jgi:myo-inositol-1(or 4)-monophosphatase
MKGKRKAKASKWDMKFQFETEAQRSMFSRSEKASNRFLDAALQLGSAHEPLGRLAGAPSNPHSKSPDLPALLLSVINIVCEAGQLLEQNGSEQTGQGGRGTRQ